MKSYFLKLQLLFLLIQPLCGEINLVRPKDGEIIPRSARGVIVAGNVGQDAARQIWVNKEKVDVYKTGSFASYVPIVWENESFKIIVSSAADLPPAIERFVKSEPRASTATVNLITSSLEPKADLIELGAGEISVVSFQGPERGRARFKIDSVTGKINMEEARPGFYQGRFTLAASDVKEESQEGEIIIFFDDNKGDSFKIHAKKIIRFREIGYWPKMAKASKARARILSSPQAGSYWFSVSSGTALTITGIYGNLYRARLSDALNGWVSKDEMDLKKIFPKSASIETVEVKESTEPFTETWVKIGFKNPSDTPFFVEEISETELNLRVFNAKIHLNWIPYRPSGQASLVENVSWFIPQGDEVDFKIVLKKPLRGGYWAENLNGNIVIRLRHFDQASAGQSPAVNPYKDWLRGRRVLIDPGHGGKDDGALAPSGRKESEVNLRLASALADVLETKGAQVALTRLTTDQTVTLEERVEMARRQNPDFVVSLHCNDLAHWINPFNGEPFGYSFYYYQIGSFGLAKTLEDIFIKSDLSGIPNNGVTWADLYLTRELTIPVILIESGYLILPWQEELLIWDEKFLENYSSAIALGLERYAMGK